MRRDTCRQRKLVCGACGYTVRATRAWMMVGLPQCPCGDQLRPESAADLAFIGEIGPSDMSQAQWNAICRENGWDIMRNAGQHKQALGKAPEVRRIAPAEQCAYPGCGRWVKHGETKCAMHAPELAAAIPF